MNYHPDPHYALGLEFEENRARLDNGSFVTRAVVVEGDFHASPSLSWQNLIQADNQSDELGLQSRLRWIRRDGQELFLVAYFDWQQEVDGTIHPGDRDIALKILYSIRL